MKNFVKSMKKVKSHRIKYFAVEAEACGSERIVDFAEVIELEVVAKVDCSLNFSYFREGGIQLKSKRPSSFSPFSLTGWSE